MSKLQAILFDVDGTLADTERDGHRVAFNAAFRAAGLDWDWDVALYGELLAVTGGKERMKHYAQRYRPQALKEPGFDALVAKLHADKTERYTALLEQGGIPLRPGVERLLKEARDAGVRLAIATTTTPVNVTALLRSTLGEDGESWFELIAAGDIVPKKKPAADIYVYSLERMGLKPDACIAIEDSANGVRSATDAGLATLVTVNAYTEDDDVSDAALVIDQLGEPGTPFTLLQGRDTDKRYVDVALLEQLLAGE